MASRRRPGSAGSHLQTHDTPPTSGKWNNRMGQVTSLYGGSLMAPAPALARGSRPTSAVAPKGSKPKQQVSQRDETDQWEAQIDMLASRAAAVANDWQQRVALAEMAACSSDVASPHAPNPRDAYRLRAQAKSATIMASDDSGSDIVDLDSDDESWDGDHAARTTWALQDEEEKTGRVDSFAAESMATNEDNDDDGLRMIAEHETHAVRTTKVDAVVPAVSKMRKTRRPISAGTRGNHAGHSILSSPRATGASGNGKTLSNTVSMRRPASAGRRPGSAKVTQGDPVSRHPGTVYKGRGVEGVALRRRPASAKPQGRDLAGEARSAQWLMAESRKGDTVATLQRARGRGDMQQVFIVCGPYAEVRKGLLRRGWKENDEKSSVFFDFKWTLYDNEVPYNSLRREQVVNHFERNDEITTKVGLCRNMPNLRWVSDINPDTFYPRCYDVGDPTELQCFLQDFRLSHGECLLRRYLRRGRECVGANAATIYLPHGGSWFVRLALTAARRHVSVLRGEHEEIDNDFLCSNYLGLSDSEWEALVSYAEHVFTTESWAPPSGLLGGFACSGIDNARGEEDALLYHRCAEAIGLIDRLHPQAMLEGEHGVWIMKPTSTSKGVGIRCFNQLGQILTGQGREAGRVIQKYIERPLLISNKKFDLRQWVLVTSWEPLTIFFYEDCLVRFCNDAFSLKDLEDRTRHLCNFSVNKKGKIQSERDDLMWTSSMLETYLSECYGDTGMWRRRIQPSLQRLCLHSLQSGQNAVSHRSGSFEFYGFDIVLDERFHPWLIEINLSPDLRPSTEIKRPLCEAAVEDTLKVVVDVGLDRISDLPVDGCGPILPAHERPVALAGYDVGGWVLSYRNADVQLDERTEGGDMMLIVTGSKLASRPYQRFENAADRYILWLSAIRIQMHYRRFRQRRKYRQTLSQVVLVQSLVRCTTKARAFRKAKRSVVLLLACAERQFSRYAYLPNLMASWLQAQLRRALKSHRFIRLLGARCIQATCRRTGSSRSWCERRRFAVRLQATFRAHKERRMLRRAVSAAAGVSRVQRKAHPCGVWKFPLLSSAIPNSVLIVKCLDIERWLPLAAIAAPICQTVLRRGLACRRLGRLLAIGTLQASIRRVRLQLLFRRLMAVRHLIACAVRSRRYWKLRQLRINTILCQAVVRRRVEMTKWSLISTCGSVILRIAKCAPIHRRHLMRQWAAKYRISPWLRSACFWRLWRVWFSGSIICAGTRMRLARTRFVTTRSGTHLTRFVRAGLARHRHLRIRWARDVIANKWWQGMIRHLAVLALQCAWRCRDARIVARCHIDRRAKEIETRLARRERRRQSQESARLHHGGTSARSNDGDSTRRPGRDNTSSKAAVTRGGRDDKNRPLAQSSVQNNSHETASDLLWRLMAPLENEQVATVAEANAKSKTNCDGRNNNVEAAGATGHRRVYQPSIRDSRDATQTRRRPASAANSRTIINPPDDRTRTNPLAQRESAWDSSFSLAQRSGTFGAPPRLATRAAAPTLASYKPSRPSSAGRSRPASAKAPHHDAARRAHERLSAAAMDEVDWADNWESLLETTLSRIQVGGAAKATGGASTSGSASHPRKASGSRPSSASRARSKSRDRGGTTRESPYATQPKNAWG